MSGIRAKKIWIDGRLADWDAAEARFHVAASGLHYADAVFEGMRFYERYGRPLIFRLGDHIRRLYDSAKIVLLNIPYGPAEIEKAIMETIRANELIAGYIRPIVFSGDGELGLGASNPSHTAILVWEWGAYLGQDGVENGIRMKTSSHLRTSGSLLLKAKASGNYILSRLAKREAKMCGFDEALHLDERGLVTEASAANIFMVRNNVLITPPLGSAILAGITRDTVITLARHKIITEVIEREMTRDELYAADECFLCGTAVEVTPVREIDGRPIGFGAAAGKVGPVTKRLQELYGRVVRGRYGYPNWLTSVK